LVTLRLRPLYLPIFFTDLRFLGCWNSCNKHLVSVLCRLGAIYCWLYISVYMLFYFYPRAAPHTFIYLYLYILQANEQNIKISIKQTETQPQYSMFDEGWWHHLHVTENKNTNTHLHNNTRIIENWEKSSTTNQAFPMRKLFKFICFIWVLNRDNWFVETTSSGKLFYTLIVRTAKKCFVQ